MSWIKRNLFFVIGSVVAVVLMVGAGFYNFTKWQANAAVKEELNKAYEELKRLNNAVRHPGDGKKVDNIKAARDQEAEVRAVLAKTGKFFQKIPPIPETTNAQGILTVSSEDYASSLRKVIDQLQKEATNASVILPPKYKFSFEAQSSLIRFAPGSLEPLAVQLGEVKVLAGILHASKVNSIEAIRRERVSADDFNNGPVTDYLDRASVTNDLAIITPYELTFRCFSAELAAVLAGMANSPYSLVVKAVNVEPAVSTTTTDASGMPVSTPAYTPPPIAPVFTTPAPLTPGAPSRYGAEEGGEAALFARRYGGKGGYTPAPTAPTPAPVAIAAPAAPKIQTVLDERQLKVTMLVYVTKMLPPKN